MKLQNAVCPACGAEVTVTYWPFNKPLYTVHIVRGTNRECAESLRPIDVSPADGGRRPRR